MQGNKERDDCISQNVQLFFLTFILDRERSQVDTKGALPEGMAGQELLMLRNLLRKEGDRMIGRSINGLIVLWVSCRLTRPIIQEQPHEIVH